MDLFEWDAAKYSVKVPKMDEEHKAIIACMNKLHALDQAKASKEKLRPAIDDLVKVTVKHFGDEEVYMASIGFPDLERHKIIHRNLLDKVTQHKAEFDATGKLSEEFFVFLKMWLKSHICGIDIKYGTYNRAA